MNERDQQTRERLLRHAEQYPKATVRDFMKFMFQSAFGCEHLIADASAAATMIRLEAEKAVPHEGDVIEPLDGDYYRVHLDVLKNGTDAETLAKLFALSAVPVRNGRELLEEKIMVFAELVEHGEIPLDRCEVNRTLDDWKEAGYPACHHSDAFREAYHPAYRVIGKAYIQRLADSAACR